MSRWLFEPGHTAAAFSARHMMVTEVRGHFKDVHGTLDWDEDTGACRVEAVLDARGIWTGEPARDAHLRSPDFLDAERYPVIRFQAAGWRRTGANDSLLTGEVTIRGVTRPVTLEVSHLGRWRTPWWEGGVDKGPKTRAGFTARAKINRHDFGVSWNGSLPDNGVVVGDIVDITIDAEAVLE